MKTGAWEVEILVGGESESLVDGGVENAISAGLFVP